MAARVAKYYDEGDFHPVISSPIPSPASVYNGSIGSIATRPCSQVLSPERLEFFAAANGGCDSPFVTVIGRAISQSRLLAS